MERNTTWLPKLGERVWIPRARRIAQAAGLSVWGTLRVLVEAKSRGWIDSVGVHVDRLEAAGMWMSTAIRRRILALAGETDD